METQKRHTASAWNVHFSVAKNKKEEGGVQTQLYYFFQWKHAIIKIPCNHHPPSSIVIV